MTLNVSIGSAQALNGREAGLQAAHQALNKLGSAAASFGFGEALVTSSGAALIADLCKERHFGTAMGTFGTIFDVGHASGPILAGLLIARFGYGTSFLALAGVILHAVPLFLATVREPTPLRA